MIQEVQRNLQRVIRIADDISNEYRRLIHVDMTSGKQGRNVKLLRELLTTDNLMRDTIVQLQKAMSSLTIKNDKHELLKDEVFLKDLGANLIQMYSSLDSIQKVMEVESGNIDEIVFDTIESLDRLSNL
jgi:hypothetical protein